MNWILHSDVVGLYFSGKDSASSPSGMTQVYLYIYSSGDKATLVVVLAKDHNGSEDGMLSESRMAERVTSSFCPLYFHFIHSYFPSSCFSLALEVAC